jgi:CBS domain-containing protein
MTEWPGSKAMFVEELLAKARERLVTIGDDALLIEAAKLLQAKTELVIVCNSEGFLIGVITKTDIVKQISHCQGASCMPQASAVMTRDILYCEAKDLLQDVWTRMRERGLKNVPVVDPTSRPLGLLHARDILEVLLSQSESDEALLRDYVMGVGYR